MSDFTHQGLLTGVDEQKKMLYNIVVVLKEKNEMLFINSKTVYDIICLSNKGVMHETMNGPFNKNLFKTPI